jgi:tripartite-type tricarboxylate transporter receptor subunit TctC
MRKLVRMITAAAVFAALLGAAGAQDRYPSRSIKFVVPFVAGSATDTLARLLGNSVSKSLGQTVIVENISGGSGIPAAQAVVRSAPDGYTIFITSNTTHASNQSMLKRVPYDAVADFEPITKLGTITLALVAHPSVPANTIQELIAYAKANPGKLTFGSGSTSSRAAGELLKTMAGIDMLHVPYRSWADRYRCSSATFRPRCRRYATASSRALRSRACSARPWRPTWCRSMRRA